MSLKNSEGIEAKTNNSVNAYLWVGVQGVVAPEFIIRPNFLTLNSRELRI
ncbi:hypothetical protein [Leptospira noguchii]|nr:hypothetical protein [Leptospira noguchii]UOG53659.1 hypothetical protein MAL09_05815 [Leptospira noguchii]